MNHPDDEPQSQQKPGKQFPSAMVASIGVGILFWVSLALILFWALRS